MRSSEAVNSSVQVPDLEVGFVWSGLEDNGIGTGEEQRVMGRTHTMRRGNELSVECIAEEE